MKIALHALIRRNNKYIREWVEHHKSVGIDHIFIYDNNRVGEDNLFDEIEDYAVGGYVTIVEWKTDKGFFQNAAQLDCYHTFGGGYDWIAFMDGDEYLQVEGGDIHNLIEDETFNDVDSIQVGAVNYTDSGIIKNETKRRLGVYTEINYNKGQRFYKDIVRTGNEKIDEFNHCPISKHGDIFRLKDADGREVPSDTVFIIEDTYRAHIDHFPTGCIDDYIHMKAACGWPDENNKNHFGLEEFYYFNWPGEEKDRYWEEHFIKKNDG